MSPSPELDEARRLPLRTPDGEAFPPHRLRNTEYSLDRRRIRYIPLVFYESGTPDATPDLDAHGSIPQNPHWDLPDAATTTVRSHPVPWPEDLIDGTELVLAWWWSNSANTGNVRFITIIRSVGQATAGGDLLNVTAEYAVPGTVNNVTETILRATVLPLAPRLVSVLIQRTGAHASDTNSGATSLWGAWLEYTTQLNYRALQLR